METIETNDFPDRRGTASVQHMPETLIPPAEIAGLEAAERRPPAPHDVPTALLVGCTCPDWCERDHDRD